MRTARQPRAPPQRLERSCASRRSPPPLQRTWRRRRAARWFQLYWYRDDAVTQSLVEQALDGGYTALVLTVDAPVPGKRERDLRSGLTITPELTVPSLEAVLGGRVRGTTSELFSLVSASVVWRDLEGLAADSGLPVIVKGVLTAEDARLACEHGAAGLVVSNHGGRQLDGVTASIDALSEVVEAVEGRIEVLVDGGVRRGTDVVKALALGARAVLIGRPFLWGSRSAASGECVTCSSCSGKSSRWRSPRSAARLPPRSHGRTSRAAYDRPIAETIHIPAREGRAVRVEAGRRFRVVDVEGGQVADTWAFVAEDPGEHHSAQHTRAVVDRLFPRPGEQFVTNRRRPILTLEEDNTPGIHDMLIAACDPARYEGLGVEGWHASCEENLHGALEPLGVAPVPRFAPQPINLFMNTPARPDGTIDWLPAKTAAGDHVVLRAELDIVVAVSACPQDIVAINRRRPSPIEIEML